MTLSFAILLGGSVLCGWAVLRCVGNECERQAAAQDERLAAEMAAAEDAAIEAATPTARASLSGRSPAMPRIPLPAKSTP